MVRSSASSKRWAMQVKKNGSGRNQSRHEHLLTTFPLKVKLFVIDHCFGCAMRDVANSPFGYKVINVFFFFVGRGNRLWPKPEPSF